LLLMNKNNIDKSIVKVVTIQSNYNKIESLCLIKIFKILLVNHITNNN